MIPLIVRGNLTAQPVVRTNGKTGDKFLAMTVAENVSIRDGEGWTDGESVFWDVSIPLSKSTEIVGQFPKGFPVAVIGTPNRETWAANGKSGVNNKLRSATVLVDTRFPKSIRELELLPLKGDAPSAPSMPEGLTPELLAVAQMLLAQQHQQAAPAEVVPAPEAQDSPF